MQILSVGLIREQKNYTPTKKNDKKLWHKIYCNVGKKTANVLARPLEDKKRQKIEKSLSGEGNYYPMLVQCRASVLCLVLVQRSGVVNGLFTFAWRVEQKKMKKENVIITMWRKLSLLQPFVCFVVFEVDGSDPL